MPDIRVALFAAWCVDGSDLSPWIVKLAEQEGIDVEGSIEVWEQNAFLGNWEQNWQESE